MSAADNPFFTASELPYQLPPFDRIRPEHFLDAFERGFSEQLAEIAAIVGDPAPATFDNTIVAMERSGRTLDRVSRVFFNATAADSTEEVQEVQRAVAPRLAAHRDAIYLDRGLASRVDAVDDPAGPEDRRLLERCRNDFRRAGAHLGADAQGRLREINTQLSALSAEFEQRLLKDTNDSAVVVDDAAELAGLSDDAIAAAAQAAAGRDQAGSYLLTLSLPTQQPVLASLDDPVVRERVLAASLSRGSRGNEHDTRSVVAKIAALRAERARLLGYPTHAAYVIEDTTAKTPSAVHEMLAQITPVAVRNARAEASRLSERAGRPIKPADWSYYAEKMRAEEYEIDNSVLRPYFSLDAVVRDGVFYAASRLYGVSFVERADLVAYHPDARVFEVVDVDGSPLGLFIGDYHTRDSKSGGAWMDSLVDQSRLLGTRPVVVNNLNVPKPPAGEPALLTFDEVRTLFHEFGHALHGLFSDVRYPTFSGTATPRDFVEYPSQVNEMWALWPEVLANYARHHHSGEALPEGLATKLRSSQQYGEGFATTEYLAATLLDLAWHEISADTSIDDVLSFEAAALERAGVDVADVPPRYRSPYFKHIFSGGYSAGYYSYIWSEILDADTVEWFKENGGLTRANGDRFRAAVLSRGGSVDPMEAFRALRGRDPQIGPLLVRRGLQ